MVFSQVAYPYIKAVSDPVHTGRCFSFFFFFFPHWWVFLFFLFLYSTLVGGSLFFFFFFPHWWGGSLFSFFPHWWGDSLVDAGHLHVEQGRSSSFCCQRDDRGKVSNPFMKKIFHAIQSKGKWVWGEPLDPKLYFFSKDFRHAAMMIKDDKYWNTCRLIFQCFNVGFVLTCISQASCLLEQSGRQSRENFDD